MRAIRWSALVALATIAACSKPEADIGPGVPLSLAEARAAAISDVRYALRFVIPEDVDQVIDGEVRIHFTLADAGDDIVLDFRESDDKVGYVTVNGHLVKHEFRNEHIILDADLFEAGPNIVGVEFLAGDTSLNRNPEYLYTLFVPDRARTAFPLFDQPDIKATFQLTLDLPGDWTAMSNALVSRTHHEGGRAEFRFAESNLIPSYLFSFVAGRFDTVSRDVDGRRMTMIHRETDEEKVARNVDDIFNLHVASLEWLEEYTSIDYPFQKFGFALIPAFQYGGMEHVGAIQYRSSSLMLDEAPSETQLLSRAGLIAHETAHMWFGNLVTMEWFNDVWTKEVFANFMAAKIVNPNFPDVDHDLNFLVRHYPRAYSVDRTEGANAIRQHLPNLNEAGQMYGAIIYNKAPIMMRQLELILGEALFQEGMQEYLSTFAFSNATWPGLIEILDRKTREDLAAWSEVWVETPGRPEFELNTVTDVPRERWFAQMDPDGLGRVWPQRFALSARSPQFADQVKIESASTPILIEDFKFDVDAFLYFNSDGYGYGLFPVVDDLTFQWERQPDVEKGSLLVNAYENLLEGSGAPAPLYYSWLLWVVSYEENQLLLDLVMNQLESVHWLLLSPGLREQFGSGAEERLWRTLQANTDPSVRKTLFRTYASVSAADEHVQRVYRIWVGDLVIADLPLSENELIELAQDLAIKMPDRAEEIIAFQLERTDNPDNRRKLEFIAPSVSPDQSVRDGFFSSLADERNRQTESWVLDALGNLHHPLRTTGSEKYILPSLELLEEIQVTGDIFFPKRWLDETLQNHRSDTAVATVRQFLSDRPDYNKQLRMKILQSADMMFRANALVAGSNAE